MIFVNLMTKTWSLKSPKFHFDCEIHPHVCSETAEHVSSCLWSHQVSQERCTTKPQVLQKAAWAWLAVKGNTVVHRNCPVRHSQDLAERHRGKRLNGKQEIPPGINPWVTTMVNGHTQIEGWGHLTAVSDSQHPGYILGLCFDSILYFP